jgi:hypothetical protein
MPLRLTTTLCLTALLPLAGGLGCGVQRTLQIETDPPGALVYLNGDEVGRTPMRKEFVWYGTYDVVIRKEGYETLVKPTEVWAPWWQLPPIDFLAELIPGPPVDNHEVRYRLKPVGEQQTDPAQILARAVETRGMLRRSRHTKERPPRGAPRQAPANRPAEAPTTGPGGQ